MNRAHKAKALLLYNAERIEMLAEAAHMIGFEDLGDRLFNISNGIKDSTNALFRAWKKEFFDHCDSIKEAGENILAATLAGLELAEKSTTEDQE